jgi:gliding motility-associated-like protein
VLNEKFGPKISGSGTKFNMSIFNRWGELIFRSSGDEMWDGTYQKTKVPIGVYAYWSSVWDSKGTKYDFMGTVTVLF